MTQDLQTKIENIISSNQQADDKDVVFRLKQLLYETEGRVDADREAQKIADLVAANLRQFTNKTNRNDIIHSGFDDFDNEFGGFYLGEFIVVGGRPAMGKTQFLVNLSMNISKTVPTLYVTLDLSELFLTSRFIASVSGIPASHLLQRDLSPAQWEQIDITYRAFTERQLYIYDFCYNTNITALIAYCQKQIQENGIQVIIVDYLQLLSSYPHRKYRELEVSFICRELKRLAKENNVSVIASSQLSRAPENRYGEGKRPHLTDLRESGAIEQDADKVIFIHRPEYYSLYEDSAGNSLKNVVEIIVAKNRNGCMGRINLLKDNDFTMLQNDKKVFAFSLDRFREIEGLDEPPF